jgi:hypothetical protein
MIHKPQPDAETQVIDTVVSHHVERSNRGHYRWKVVQTFESGRTRVIQRHVSLSKAKREAENLQSVVDMIRRSDPPL